MPCDSDVDAHASPAPLPYHACFVSSLLEGLNHTFELLWSSEVGFRIGFIGLVTLIYVSLMYSFYGLYRTDTFRWSYPEVDDICQCLFVCLFVFLNSALF